MNGRNPFTSISNLSFVRNANHFQGERPPSRSYSSDKKYFDYQGPYLKDRYLADWENRRNQEVMTSRFLGIEALRYEPEPPPEPFSTNFQSKGDYYNTQTLPSPAASLPLNSDFQNSAMKNSTKDMFGSEYFFNRQDEKKEETQGEVKPKKTSIFKNQSVFRFRQSQETKALDEVKQHDTSKSSRSLSKSNVTISQFGDPDTIFLKSRRTIFFRYKNPDQDEDEDQV